MIDYLFFSSSSSSSLHIIMFILYKKKKPCSLHHHIHHFDGDHDDDDTNGRENNHLYSVNCSPNPLITEKSVIIERKHCSLLNTFHFCLPSISSHHYKYHFVWSLFKSLSSTFYISSSSSSIFSSITWILLLLCSILFQPSFALPPSSSSSFPICRQDRSLCSSGQESEFYESGGLELNSLLCEPMRKVAN